MGTEKEQASGSSGSAGDERPRIAVIAYGPEQLVERDCESVEEAAQVGPGAPVRWISVEGFGPPEVLTDLGDRLGLHPVLLDTVALRPQSPKVEEYEGAYHIVLRALSQDKETYAVRGEQLSLVLKEGLVLSFQEWPGDAFEPVREAIRTGKGKVRSSGPDYLVCALMKAVVDGYSVICEAMGEHLGRIEAVAIGRPAPETGRRIYRAKRQIALLRRAVWPLREVTAALQQQDYELIEHPTRLHLRALHDQLLRVAETVSEFDEMAGGVMDVHLSSLSNRMNQVMKTLTIIATVFIPMTFVTGVYGMNFRYMPEIGWKWGYPAALALMGLIAAGMIVYFRRADSAE